MDRQTVERKDFPIARRGYDPEAVDAHLERLADEIERLQQSSGGAGRAPVVSLAAAASEQVRAIVEAAETSASEIERSAREEAETVRRQAAADADAMRRDASARSQEHVGRVAQAASSMLDRVGEMEGELGSLVGTLRTGADRLTSDLAQLQGEVGQLSAAPVSAAPPAPAPRAPAPPPPPPPPPVAAAPTPPAAVASPPPPEREPEPEPEPRAPEPVPAEQPLTDLTPDELFDARPQVPEGPGSAPDIDDTPAEGGLTGVEAPADGDGEDEDGARLIALNMALNGQPREETDRYLRENYDLRDRLALLDEVYATVDG